MFYIRYKKRKTQLIFTDNVPLDSASGLFEKDTLIIEFKIGSGSFGEVYRGKFGLLTVAVNQMKKNLS